MTPQHCGNELEKERFKEGAFWQERRGTRVKRKSLEGMKPTQIAKDKVFQQS